MIFTSFIQTDFNKKRKRKKKHYGVIYMGSSVIYTLIGLNIHTLFNTLPLWHACHSFIKLACMYFLEITAYLSEISREKLNA